MAKVIINLEELLENWALGHFKTKANRKQKKLLKNKNIGVEIDWRRIRVTQDEPKYEPEPPEPEDAKSLPSTLFSTTYTNHAKATQVYNFSAERTSRSTCVTTIEEGVTKGHEYAIELTTPGEIMKANAGYKRELTITKSDSQTTEEELTWEVNSEINVPGGMSAMAKMVIREAEYCGKYTLKTTMKGVIRVMFLNRKDNNSMIKNTEGDLYEIMKKLSLPANVISLDGDNKSVICKTTGMCVFKYGLKQDVEVYEKKIED